MSGSGLAELESWKIHHDISGPPVVHSRDGERSLSLNLNLKHVNVTLNMSRRGVSGSSSSTTTARMTSSTKTVSPHDLDRECLSFATKQLRLLIFCRSLAPDEAALFVPPELLCIHCRAFAPCIDN